MKWHFFPPYEGYVFYSWTTPFHMLTMSFAPCFFKKAMLNQHCLAHSCYYKYRASSFIFCWVWAATAWSGLLMLHESTKIKRNQTTPKNWIQLLSAPSSSIKKVYFLIGTFQVQKGGYGSHKTININITSQFLGTAFQSP